MARRHVGIPRMRSVFILHRARLACMLLLSAMLLAAPSAEALPPASGSKCSSNWVNNEAAMSCFVQGEEEVRNGAAHPHYVACTAAGDVFCCVDKDNGQDCQSVGSIVVHKPPNIGSVTLRAMLESQRSIATILNRLSADVDKLASSVARNGSGTTSGAPPADARTTDAAAVRAASAEWAKVAAAKDLDKTLSYYSDDASMFPPNMPAATGPQARRALWASMLAQKDLVFSNAATSVEVARSGDLAYETGTFQESFTDGVGKPVRVTGKYVVVWKKQASGQWKAAIDVFNADQ